MQRQQTRDQTTVALPERCPVNPTPWARQHARGEREALAGSSARRPGTQRFGSAQSAQHRPEHCCGCTGSDRATAWHSTRSPGSRKLERRARSQGDQTGPAPTQGRTWPVLGSPAVRGNEGGDLQGVIIRLDAFAWRFDANFGGGAISLSFP